MVFTDLADDTAIYRVFFYLPACQFDARARHAIFRISNGIGLIYRYIKSLLLLINQPYLSAVCVSY